jgi:antitoxin HigA-1
MMMPMKNPPHPGRGLKDDIDALGLTVAEAAEALGITRQQLYNIVSGRSGITAEMALRLEKGVGSTADAWLKMQAAYDLAQLRRRGETDIKVKKLAPRVA